MFILEKLLTKFFKLHKEPISKIEDKTNLDTGHLGEEIAKNYLKRKGYKIIEQNWRTKCAEIDLVTRKKDVLVFVEVRTKTDDQFGTPEETLNKKKINRLIRSSQIYIKYKNYTDRYRIDSVCVMLNSNWNLVRLTHYPNITL
jgi:putative endonuclease